VGVAGWVGLEAVAAVVTAEPVRLPVEVGARGCVGRLDLHTANRIDGVLLATAKPVLVAAQPIQKGKDTEEGDIKKRCVVPLQTGPG
jgi:hypothetical protein